MRPTIWPETLELIVKDYRSKAADRGREAEWWKAEGQPFSEVIKRVGDARMENKRRHSHQRRLTDMVAEECVKALGQISDKLEAANNFHCVFKLVEDAFKEVSGVGELAAYDAADRICRRLGLVSQDIVYLHTGTRVGAQRLFGGRLAGEEARAIQHSKLPDRLRVLSTREAEDVLCVYKDDFLLSPNELRAKLERRSVKGCGGRESSSSC